jgi:lysophospholipase L1-like esterase
MKSMKLIGAGRAALFAGVLASALLASCGGGQAVSSFTATRVLSFGDESSVINANGSKYTVNAFVTGSTSALDCTADPLWIQEVASIYGLQFPQCSQGSPIQPISQIFATNGAKAADLSTQIDQLVATGGFAPGDLVTVLVGSNDVIAQFTQYPAVGEDQLLGNVAVAGAEVAAQVDRMVSLGAKVLVSTIPDMGLTPYAGDRSVGSANQNPAVLSALSSRFNDALLRNLTNDGTLIGLIQLDEYITSSDTATQAGTGTYANTTLASCQSSAPLPTCTTSTLVANAVGAVWLWADNLHLSASGQANLGSLAITRARNNPF